MREQAVKIISEFVEQFGYHLDKIILFGSRARGDAKPDSDWDFLVLVQEELTFHQKQKLVVQIKRKLARLRIPNDIIIKSKRGYELSKDKIGTVSFYASIEGIQS